MGKLFVVSSPSASGKTTLVDKIVTEFNLEKLKTCTTRPIRKEEAGDEYYFLNKPCFEYKIEQDEFIEHSKVYKNYYGVYREEFEKFKEKDCIIILDVQGKEKVEKEFKIVSIFIKPPSKETVEKRLNSRNTSKEDVNARLKYFETELEEIEKFDHVIEYGELNFMLWQMRQVILGELKTN